jgi:hypothetical protein
MLAPVINGTPAVEYAPLASVIVIEDVPPCTILTFAPEITVASVALLTYPDNVVYAVNVAKSEYNQISAPPVFGVVVSAA